MKNRTVLFVSFLLFVAVTLSFAQSPTDSTKHQKTFVFPKKSLQFSVHTYNGLGTFEGGLISAKYHLSNTLAFRFGLDASMSMSNTNKKKDGFYGDSLNITNENQADIARNSFMFVSAFIHYFNPNDAFKLYAGIGPVFGVNFRSRNTEYIDPQGSDSDNTLTQYSVGLQTEYGLEWFFRKNMSLMAQYGFRVLYSWSSGEETSEHVYSNGEKDIYTTTINSWDFMLNTGITHFGVSVYF